MNEEWKAISGFEKYEVSNHGNVRNSSTEKIIMCISYALNGKQKRAGGYSWAVI